MSAADEHTTARRLSRRNFLLGLGLGTAAAGAGAYGVDQWVGHSGPAPRHKDPHHHRRRRFGLYRSAPHLKPPLLHVSKLAPGTGTGLLFLTPAGGAGQYGPMIADNTGEPVWFHALSGPWPPSTKREAGAEFSTNFRVSQYKGKRVLSWWQGQLGLGTTGESRYVIADDQYRQLTSFPAGNGLHGDTHEFAIATDDTALITFYQAIPADLSSIGGPSSGSLLDCGFQRLDIATGDVLFQWRASDHISYEESYRPITGQGTSSSPWDFFHINSVDVDVDGSYLISARHTWAVYKIDQTTGTVVWRLNGKESDFQMDHRARFSWQHDARHHGSSRISLFDDGAGVYKTASHSRGLLLTLDTDSMTARMTEEYLLPGVLAYAQGSVQLEPDHDVFVGWGSEPVISEYTHDGRLLFEAALPHNSDSYRSYRFAWSATPTWPPAVAVESTTRSPRVFASWNGATEVAKWRLLAGEKPHGLRPIGQVAKSGFETTLHAAQASSSDRYFAVVAMDSRGHTLGRSKAARAA